MYPIASRWLRGALLACGTAALMGSACAARLAMVIGNDDYRHLRGLKNSVQDARDVASELRSAHFELPDKWLLTNADRRRMDAALQDFVSHITDQDEIVFYYSGHGVEIDATAALVPVDLSDPARRPIDGGLRALTEVGLAKQQILDESITLNRVAADIAARGPRFSLLVVDACRDNPVLDLLKAAHAAHPTRSTSAPPSAGLIVDAAADSQVLLFSASKGQQALDRLGDKDPVRNGVFTRVLLKAMRTPDLGLREMLPRIKDEVRQLAAQARSNGRPHVQEPRSIAAYDAPDFVFRTSPRPRPGDVVQAPPPPPPAPTSVPPDTGLLTAQAWETARTAHTSAAYAAYLAEFPAGPHVPAAKVALAALHPQPQPQPQPHPAATTLRAGQTLKDCASCPDLVVIPAGSFLMGSDEAEPEHSADETPRRRVDVKAFLMGRHEVTQAQWTALMGNNPSAHSGWFSGCSELCPVENISWHDAQEYTRRLSQLTGKRYRLPSEAEWEYAARAGTASTFSTGRTLSSEQANIDGSVPFQGGGVGPNRKKPLPVASLASNDFGLYDMHGNVYEWVSDPWHPDYHDAPVDGSTWLTDGDDSRRVIRGGSWLHHTAYARSAYRNWEPADLRAKFIGLRVVREP